MNLSLQDFVGKYKSQIDAGIVQELESRLQEVKEISLHLVPILQAMRELSVGGKRLRGMLVILGYELSGGHGGPPLREIIKAAVVMELFHLGLLIQDDFMDRDLVRRGVPTIIARYEDRHVGNFISMLAGDYTFGWGIENLSELKLEPRRVNAGMAVWGKYFTRVGYGQTLDGLDIADDETILKILAIKSGEYSCVLPLLLGATLGGADQKLLERLEKYGMEMGWVFQLRDDWFGYDKDMMKKGKKTFATMYGKTRTEEAIVEHMTKGSILAQSLQGQSSQVDLMCSLVEWLGTRKN